jgi:predicted MFS family arabinose efflux permease
MRLTNRPGYCWLVLAAGTMAVYSALGLARFGYSVVLPAMQSGLGMDNAQAGALASANLTGYLCMALLGGAMAAHWGARSVIVAGLTVAGIGMFLTGTVDGFSGAAFWRAVTGIGSGAANVAVMGMWTAWFPPNRRGLAAGIAVTGSSLAFITIGPLVPWILALGGAAGWRYCWQLFGGVTMLIAMLCLIVIRSRPAAATIDLSSPYAGSNTPPADRHGSWHDVYRSPAAWHLGLVYVAFGFSYIIFMTFFVKHLMVAGGYSKAAAGSLFMAMGWANLACSFLWGGLSDRIGRKWAMAIIYLVHAAAFTLFGMAATPAVFTLAALLYGSTAFSIPAIMAAACGDLFGQRLAPASLGFVTLLFGIGQALGPSVAGLMADATGSFSSAFLLAAAVALLGAIGATTLRTASGRPTQ